MRERMEPEGHYECIQCPKCGAVQHAFVEHVGTQPFYNYAHFCESCGHTITESEWEYFRHD